MFEFEVFKKQCTGLKKILVTLFGLFGTPQSFGAPIGIRRQGNCAPLVTTLRPYKCQLVLLGFEKNEIAAVANERIFSEFPTKTRRLPLQVPP